MLFMNNSSSLSLIILAISIKRVHFASLLSLIAITHSLTYNYIYNIFCNSFLSIVNIIMKPEIELLFTIACLVIYYCNYIFTFILNVTALYIAWQNMYHFPLKEYETPLVYFFVLNFIMVLMGYVALYDMKSYVNFPNKELDKYEVFQNQCGLQFVVYCILCFLYLIIVIYYFMYYDKPNIPLWLFALLTLSTTLRHFVISNWLNENERVVSSKQKPHPFFQWSWSWSLIILFLWSIPHYQFQNLTTWNHWISCTVTYVSISNLKTNLSLNLHAIILYVSSVIHKRIVLCVVWVSILWILLCILWIV